jgi:hypothetical protein
MSLFAFVAMIPVADLRALLLFLEAKHDAETSKVAALLGALDRPIRLFRVFRNPNFPRSFIQQARQLRA